MLNKLIPPLLLAMVLAACSSEVSFETLETARAQARENAEFNAKAWREKSEYAAALHIVTRGDSSQTPSCPQGDGWASIELVSDTGLTVQKLKCSTVSLSVGCLKELDFKKSQFASEDGWCASTNKVPHPLPKLVM